MTVRTMTLLICGLALCVSRLPNNRETPAAASEATYIESEFPTVPTLAQEVTDEPLVTATKCENGFCRQVTVPASQVCDRCGKVHASPVKGSAAGTTERSIVTKRVTYQTRQPVFRANDRFMQRGPVRRVFGRVGRGVCRVVFSPFRWLRRR